MRAKLIFLGFLLISIYAKAQVGIGTTTPNASAQLDVISLDKGVLIPRLALTSSTDVTTISNGNVVSMLVYNTATVGIDISPGFYYWNGTQWERVLNETNISSFETLTTLSIDIPNQNLLYRAEDGNVNTIDLSPLLTIDTNTTNTSLSVVGPNLTLADSDGNSVSVLLSTIASEVNTDNQIITNFGITGSDLSITLEDGNTQTVSLASIASMIDTNTTNVSFAVVGSDLVLTDSDGNTVNIALSNIAAGVDTNTTNITFAVVGTDLVMTDSEGNSVSVALSNIAAGVDTDNQSLFLTGTNLNITNGAGVDLTDQITLPMLADGTSSNTGIFWDGTQWVY